MSAARIIFSAITTSVLFVSIAYAQTATTTPPVNPPAAQASGNAAPKEMTDKQRKVMMKTMREQREKMRAKAKADAANDKRYPKLLKGTNAAQSTPSTPAPDKPAR